MVIRAEGARMLAGGRCWRGWEVGGGSNVHLISGVAVASFQAGNTYQTVARMEYVMSQ